MKGFLVVVVRVSGWVRARWRRRWRGTLAWWHWAGAATIISDKHKRSPTPDGHAASSHTTRPTSARSAMFNMKLKERLALAASAGVVLFTLMLVVDLQMDYGIAGRRVPLHGRVRIGDDADRGRSAYIEFRKRFLQKR